MEDKFINIRISEIESIEAFPERQDRHFQYFEEKKNFLMEDRKEGFYTRSFSSQWRIYLDVDFLENHKKYIRKGVDVFVKPRIRVIMKNGNSHTKYFDDYESMKEYYQIKFDKLDGFIKIVNNY